MSDAIEVWRITLILRIFDVAKADEFYLGYLGFAVDWDHRFDDNAAPSGVSASSRSRVRAPRRWRSPRPWNRSA